MKLIPVYEGNCGAAFLVGVVALSVSSSSVSRVR